MKKTYNLKNLFTLFLLGFATLLLGTIFLFQTFFLDDFYQNSKAGMLKSVAEEIADNLSSDNLNEVLRSLSMNNEVCVYLLSSDQAISGSKDGNCALYMLDYRQLNDIASKTMEAGGEYLFKDYRASFGYKNEPTSVYIYGKWTENTNDRALILVSSMITPLDATISTIQHQFWGIAAVVLLLTGALGYLFSKRIMKPIESLQKEAVNLPFGHYDKSQVDSLNIKELEDLNNTLNQANEQIKQVDLSRKELLSNVSHDLRTPLTMIVGYAEMIKDFKGENEEENAEVIITEAKRLNALVDDLLDVSRLEGNRLQLHPEECSLKEFLEGIFGQYEAYFKTQSIDFILDCPMDGIVSLDKKRTAQILYNFLNNALNYNNNPNPQIKLTAHKIKEGFRISVYDNGRGISEKDLPFIWDRYYKVQEEHVRSHIGSGIGLSLARDLLKAQGFSYGVCSEENEYSEFWFIIPETNNTINSSSSVTM